MRPTVLVYGWYFRGNVGDDLFISAFKHLFPEFDFAFVDHLSVLALSQNNVSAVFFGGGSFLYAKPAISDEALQLLSKMKIFYIGVGTETAIHPTHQMLMGKAQLIATRSLEQLEKVKAINPNTIYIPDIVYALQEKVEQSPKLPRSVLILPNIDVVSQYSEPAWKTAAWEYFKSEFAQFLDALYDDGFNIHFYAMCKNAEMNDNWAATEIINKMVHRSDKYTFDADVKTIESITKLFSQFDTIITQRYHGIILSELTRVPYLIIHHHDKLKNSHPRQGGAVSYYGLSKQKLLDEFSSTVHMNFSSVLPIESNMFTELQQKVLGAINNGG